MVIYPRGSVSISLTLGSGSGVPWNQAWSVVRGAAGIAAGASAASGTYDYTFREWASLSPFLCPLMRRLLLWTKTDGQCLSQPLELPSIW
jgi:hypothetical protein